MNEKGRGGTIPRSLSLKAARNGDVWKNAAGEAETRKALEAARRGTTTTTNLLLPLARKDISCGELREARHTGFGKAKAKAKAPLLFKYDNPPSLLRKARTGRGVKAQRCAVRFVVHELWSVVN